MTVQDTLLVNENIDRSLFVKTSELTALDRCDACSSRAYVRATNNESELLFCAHHAKKHVVALMTQGWLIDDQTFQITEDVVNSRKGALTESDVK